MQYQRVVIPREIVENMLTQFESEGWELISFQVLQGIVFIGHFKREKLEQEKLEKDLYAMKAEVCFRKSLDA